MKPPANQSALKQATRSGLQYAALPYRWVEDELEILLLTSRETHRWVIPKGWPMKGKKPHAAAAQEAREEAGVVGKIAKAPFGAYTYVKRLKNGAGLVCRVDVFPLPVARQLKRWREQAERSSHWFSIAEAAQAVNEPELHTLIEAFGANPPRPVIKTKRVRPAKTAQPATEPPVPTEPASGETDPT